MARFKAEFKGIRQVQKRLGLRGAARLRDDIDKDMRKGIDDMADTSFKLAPVETGALKISIKESKTKEGWAEYIYGSRLPYAQRQEYEHDGNKYDPTPKRGYFRKSVAMNTPKIEARLRATIQRRLFY